MKRRMRRMVVALLLCGVSGLAWAAPPAASWSRLGSWNGHYPSDRVGPNGTMFFQDPQVARTLKALLPAAALQLVLRIYSLQDQFSTVGDYLITDVCAPHDCGAENATLVFGLKDMSTWVALFSHRGAVVSTHWYGTKDYVDLPQVVLNAVLAVHRPAP